MRAQINSFITAILPLLLCLMSSSSSSTTVNASRHRHQQQHQSENSVQSSAESSSTIAYHSTNGKSRTKNQQERRTAGDQMDIDSLLPNTSPNKTPDLMKEYMSRQLFMCSSNYLGTLSKLHALIKEAYEEYSECQKQVKASPKNYAKTSFSMLNDLLNEWKDEDDGQPEDNDDSTSVEIDSVEELRPSSQQ